MPLGKDREKILFGLAKGRALHRYTLARIVVGVLFTVVVALIPLLGILRFDLWHGNHVVLGEPSGFVAAMKAFVFPFLALNILIILASRFIGRYLCGFVCPVGALARVSEWMRWKNERGQFAWWRFFGVAAACALLAAITFSFWIDWRVLTEGSATAIVLSAGFLIGTFGGLLGIVRWMGMRFCRDLCPSGVYFALLGPETTNGVQFAHPEACTDCHACERACPMDLQPTKMEAGEPRSGIGFYPDGLSSHALCIRCGDCVAVCEATTEKDELTPLVLGWMSGSDSGSKEDSSCSTGP